MRVKILDSDPAVDTGALKVKAEHLKSASCASQCVTNKLFFVLLAATFTALMAEAELAV